VCHDSAALSNAGSGAGRNAGLGPGWGDGDWPLAFANKGLHFLNRNRVFASAPIEAQLS
jgi:hypothetical protein